MKRFQRHRFLFDKELSERAFCVYIYLEDRANKDGICFPSVKTIASDLHVSANTVRRAIKDLKQANLITTKQRIRENGGKSSLEFTLLNYGGKTNDEI